MSVAPTLRWPLCTATLPKASGFRYPCRATGARTRPCWRASLWRGWDRLWRSRARPPRGSSRPTWSSPPSPTGGRQVMVMDNLPAHKPRRVRELIEARGCELVYLPGYSPEYNPIEEAFSKIKEILRRAAARTREALVEALGLALSAV